MSDQQMPGSGAPSLSELSPATLERIDAVCLRFEEDWQQGHRPILEERLGAVPEPERAVLFAELIKLDLFYRTKAGEQMALTDYLSRFPQYREQLDALVPPADGVPKMPCVPGYEISPLLGRGAMGVVYLARHKQLNRQVALKMILAGSLAGPDDIARFLSEAEAVAALQHPNIVQVFEVGRHEGMPYMALEYVSGGSLAKKLQTGPLPPRQAARLVEQLARGMNVAHQAGIVHRDLKPGNVLLTPEGTPKITDFGLAKRVEATAKGEPTSSEPLTQTGAILGTPNYMAPEQAQGHSRRVGPAADIYALGALLYQCLTGQPPFKADSVLKVLKQVVDEEPAPPRHLQPGIPNDLQTICLKCLSKQPQQRYASAEALAEDLRRWQACEPILARPVGQLERITKWVRRRPAAAALMAAALLLLLAGLGAGCWYQTVQIWWVGEQARQEAELTARQTYLNQEVAAAVREADEKQQNLRTQLSDSLKVHVLLSDLSQWQQALAQIKATVMRAQSLTDGAPELLDPALAERLQGLHQQLTEHDQAYALAVKLDAVRQEAYLWVEGNFNTAAAGPKIAAAFKQAGLALDHSTAAHLAERIRQSPARHALVAALDFWAQVAADSSFQERLLSVARLADSDPWRDEVRDAGHWQNLKALEELVTKADLAHQSPQIIIVLVNLLVSQQSDPLPLLRQAVLAHPQDFWLYFTLGLNCKLPAERIGYYQAALAVRPRSSAALTNLGVALTENKNVTEAIACFKKAIAIDPTNAVAHNNLGKALLDVKDIAGATSCLEKALQLNPRFAAAHFNLGSVLLTDKKSLRAIASYKKALEIDPNFVPAHNGLGGALHAKKDDVAAIACYRKALELDPLYVNAHFGLGIIRHDGMDPAGAIAYYKKALEIDPVNAPVCANLGLALLEIGDLAGGIANCKKAIAIDPKHATGHLNLGVALQHKGDLAGAVACYRKALEIDPTRAQAYFNLGIIFSATADKTGAVACYKKALKLDPECAAAYNNLGVILRDGKDVAGAIACLKRAVELKPNFAQAHNNLGLALRDEKDLVGAIASFQKALKIDPTLSQAHANLGDTLRNMGDLDGGIAHFQQSLAIRPESAEIQLALGETLLVVGRFVEARHAMAQALQLLPPGQPLYQSAQMQRLLCDRLITLDQKLAAIQKGLAQPVNADELLALANLCCTYKKQYAAGAKFFTATFAVAPELTKDLKQPIRDIAACAAALAAAGKGKDAAKLDASTKAKLRQQALNWLRADLKLWQNLSQSKQPAARQLLLARLSQWQTNSELFSVRDMKALAQLPEPERQAWQALWADVAALIQESKK